MLLNGNFRRMDKHDEIENQIHSNTIKNVRNYDQYSQKEIKESLNTIENISTQFSLWMNDLEIQVNNAICSRSKEIKLEGFNLNRENSSSGTRFSFGKIFNNFEKLRLEGDDLEIDQEVEKYLKENKRAANKRRKNFSTEDERNFIKKKPKENISKQIKPNENISNMINVTDLNLTEIETRINSAGENIFREYFALIDFENNNEHVTEPPSENNLNSIFDNRQNTYFLTNQNKGLKEVIEEMPSKEEENFKFSLSFIDKKDSNVEMNEERKSKSNSHQDEFSKNIGYFVDPKQPVLEFNLKSVSVVKSIQEKCSKSISTLKNFCSDDLIHDHANNFNFSEADEKVIKDIYFTEANIDDVFNNITNMDSKDKLDINCKTKELIQQRLYNISKNPYNTINLERVSIKPASNVNDVNESKEAKIIFKSSNIKMNMSKSLNTNKYTNNNDSSSNDVITYLKNESAIGANKEIGNIKPSNADFTFFKEKLSNNALTSCDKIPIAIDVSSKSQVKSANVITNSNEANEDAQTSNLNSNFLKDKEKLFNILFNYNESFSNIQESPAVEKWNPNKLESTSKKLGNFKSNLNNTNLCQNMSENNSKMKIVLNKVFKDKEEFSNIDIKESKQNLFKSSKQSKPLITNNIQTIHANQTSNTKNTLANSQNNFNFSKTKNYGNSSQNFDSEKKFNIMNNITKTLSKKLIDPGYEITDQSCSSSDDKKDSDSEDKANGTPMFKSLKIPKHIPKWANDKKYLNERVLYQKSKMDYKVIFGSCKVDDLNLNLIFTKSKKEYNQPRGDSADWKLDNTISSHQQEDKNIEGGNYRNYYNSIDMNYSNNKNTCGTNRKLLEVFNEINY